MGKIKVGDKVRVVGNTTCHGFDVGSIVTVVETYVHVVGVTDGICKYYLSTDEYEPISTNRIVVGGEYTSYNGHEWKCIHIDGDYAWLNERGDRPSAAYVFKTDGTNICQGGGKWDIKFAPVVETVKFRGGVRTGYLENSTVHPEYADHKFNMTVDFIDDKPDWSTAKVTDA